VRRVRSSIAFPCALAPLAALAQVDASLVACATSIQPGRPFTVALRLQHAPHWHTYWINPGIGYPSSLAWHLPPGFTAGDIQWPTPELLKTATGEVTGNGYLGDTLLMVTLTLPQQIKRTVDGGYALTLHLSAAGSANPPGRLHGILVNEGGWQSDGSLHGLRVDAAWN
jgi:DsbC/DsbD-like thiol-disulfide interchange protein